MFRYPMQHNNRRRTILRLFATLLETGYEINVIFCAGVEVAAALGREAVGSILSA
jgi:hypothetical protein